MLAWRLAQNGFDAFLTPMYDQMFVVDAVKPDVVVTNYIRSNNVDLIRDYKRRGCRIVVVDTEGAVGQTATGLVEMMARSGGAELADRYCVWGNVQYEGFLSSGLLDTARLRATGSPRYDFASDPWRSSLQSPAVTPGYVLINTNLSAIAPRFSQGADAERAVLQRVGMSEDYITARLRDEYVARDGLIELLSELTRSFPRTQFVLRPHPFESSEPYASLAEASNFQIRQERTSLEWLNGASVLIHLNCTTAIEAVMLGKEPLSPAWLDSPALHIDGAADVSRMAQSKADMERLLKQALSGVPLPTDEALASRRAKVIRDAFLRIDGGACQRITTAIIEALGEPQASSPAPTMRHRILAFVRRLLGSRVWMAMRSVRDPYLRKRYAAKALDISTVGSLLARVSAVGGGATVRSESAEITARNARGAIRIYPQPG